MVDIVFAVLILGLIALFVWHEKRIKTLEQSVNVINSHLDRMCDKIDLIIKMLEDIRKGSSANDTGSPSK